MIFGIKRTGTFIPRPRTKTTPGLRGPMGGADRPRPRLHPLRTDLRHRHAHHIIHWKDGGQNRPPQTFRPFCSRCHNDLHHGRYTITMDTHTIPVITHTRGPLSKSRPGGRLSQSAEEHHRGSSQQDRVLATR